jgi:hypothetical protein
VLAVLHTWDRQLNFHPHVHCPVSGGGISETAPPGTRRRRSLPVKALARLVRGRLRDLLRRRCPDLVVPDAVWRLPWIAHVTAWGEGEQAVLDYLARYVFRIAISNARLTGLDETGVTFRYRDRKSGRQRSCRLTGEEFLRRFLQHVLPRGLHKVRYFGLWHPARRADAARVRQMLRRQPPPPAGPVPEPPALAPVRPRRTPPAPLSRPSNRGSARTATAVGWSSCACFRPRPWDRDRRCPPPPA